LFEHFAIHNGYEDFANETVKRMTDNVLLKGIALTGPSSCAVAAADAITSESVLNEIKQDSRSKFKEEYIDKLIQNIRNRK